MRREAQLEVDHPLGSGVGDVAGEVGNGPFGDTTGDYDFFRVFADAGDTIRVANHSTLTQS